MFTGNPRRAGRKAPKLSRAHRLLSVLSPGLGAVGFGAVGFAAIMVAFFCACGGRHPAGEPVDDINDACCRVANDDMTKFAGCRPTGRCAKDEPIWMRGYIKCSAVEVDRCAGGRCCEYRPMYGSPDSVLHWDDSSGEEQPSPPAAEVQALAPQGAPATPVSPEPGEATTPNTAAPQGEATTSGKPSP